MQREYDHPVNKLDISKFYVISVISNPIRYRARYNLFKEFETHVKDLGAQFMPVEQAFGRRPHIITERDNPLHIQVRTNEELWHKENMINIGIQQLCQYDPDWQYVAWIDGDIHFNRRDIFLETAQQLQHYGIVQMFSHAIDLGPNMEPIQKHNGFMWSYFENGFYPPQNSGHGGYYGADGKAFWHPGFAWAARRETVDRLPLYDKAILGSGDHHMALALIGEAKRSLPGNVSPAYRDSVLNWQDNAEAVLSRNVGYVPGIISHYWHGSKKNRKYIERWQVLTRNQYDPYKDIIKDGQGMYVLNKQRPNYIKLRDDVRRYFRQRNEDDLYLPEGDDWLGKKRDGGI